MTKSFDEVLREAIADFELHGYDSEERLNKWRILLEQSAGQKTTVSADTLKRTLSSVYSSQVVRGALFKSLGIPASSVIHVLPKLQTELNRRIMAAAQLIKLNREEMIARTVRRFSGWASSIPAGGSGAIEKRDTADEIKKGLKQLPFTERRVMIDQAAKFKASLSDIVATETGAIAAIWHSHWRAAGYNYRKDHKERDGRIYVLRDNWAMQKGLMKLAGREYTDEITKPAEEPFCQCRYQYIYNLRDLPDEMLTVKGKEQISK